MLHYSIAKELLSYRMSHQVALQHGLPVEVENVGNVLTAVQLNPHSDLIRPPSRVDLDPLGDDGLREVIWLLRKAVDIAVEELGAAVDLLVVREVLAVGTVLDPRGGDIVQGANRKKSERKRVNRKGGKGKGNGKGR